MRSVQVYEGEHSLRLLNAKQKITFIWMISLIKYFTISEPTFTLL